VTAVLKEGGVFARLVDEVEYEPYGRARRTAQGDLNHDGFMTVQDIFDNSPTRYPGRPALEPSRAETPAVL